MSIFRSLLSAQPWTQVCSESSLVVTVHTFLAVPVHTFLAVPIHTFLAVPVHTFLAVPVHTFLAVPVHTFLAVPVHTFLAVHYLPSLQPTWLSKTPCASEGCPGHGQNTGTEWVTAVSMCFYILSIYCSCNCICTRRWRYLAILIWVLPILLRTAATKSVLLGLLLAGIAFPWFKHVTKLA